ncbi:MAG TPA: acylneuraminate cytidylyltransferase [Nitrospiraceae bacterium]|nr:acylneuraminate cytidylyltransferase [Nitrospiraceae bacterium]
MKILAVVQSRCGSTRLPGKVMLPLAGKEALVRLVERVQRSTLLTHTVVATTTATEDDIILDLCGREGFACFRGHPTDLLDRHYRAGLAFGADVVVKIPSDCPLIDPAIIDRVIAFYKVNCGSFDFVSNLHPPSYPDGNDIEVIPMQVLEAAWEAAEKTFEREHTTPFIWDNPDRFRIGNVTWETGLDYSMSHRWVLDYWEDYQFIKRVYEELYSENPTFRMEDILHLLTEKLHIGEINKRHVGVNWYRHHINELKTIGHEQSARKPVL